MHKLKVYNDFYYYRGDQNVQQNNMIMMNDTGIYFQWLPV